MKVKSPNGNILDIYWQQYSIGLYVAVYKDDRIFDQFGFDGSPEGFKSHLIENGFEIL